MRPQVYQTPFILSLSIHALLFLTLSAVFVKTAQYSVRSSPESIQVELEQPPVEPKVIETPKPIPPKIVQDIFAPRVVIKPEKPLPHPKPQPQPKQVSLARMVEAKPDYIQNPPPPYPELAKEMRQEGLVLLTVDVSAQGDPIDAEILKSSGHRMLDEAALEAVRHWRFQPARIGDLPIESKVTVPIRFRLQE